ncbi:PREDICTED: translation initiation factor IF-2-like isoform X1 [Calidris pugnax]|uniref:translation initiation factor IF-2-like isoform X1 n=1 Tax=Calidris pugnax TaxID=198806 RepID=UPI00071D6AFE|nr:PREDICTED: translation initiation factor IF-2-like isoform X1 [Calidris pugnax]
MALGGSHHHVLGRGVSSGLSGGVQGLGRAMLAGCEAAVWTGTELLSSSTSFPAPSPFPLVSRAPCGAVAALGAWHRTAPHGFVGSPTPAAPGPPEDGAGQGPPQQEDGSCSPRPCQGQTGPHAGQQTCCSPARCLGRRGAGQSQRHRWVLGVGTGPCPVLAPGADALSLADGDAFNVVPVTTARLSHPTATRPRVPGQRPPSLALGSVGGPCGGEQPWGLGAPLPGAGQAPGPPWSTEVLVAPRSGETLALEDLKAEVRSLHILVDLMRVQHLRDLEDMRLEMCQERAKRQALQAEIERVRKALPC